MDGRTKRDAACGLTAPKGGGGGFDPKGWGEGV